MLSEYELNAYADRHALSEKARLTIKHVRGNQPSRRVSSGKRNVSCRYASLKMKCVIQAESHQNELAAVVGWEHDRYTYEFYDQPPKIRVRSKTPKGRSTSYLITPDYFILQEGFVGWVECKTEEWLKARLADGSISYVRDEDGQWRFLPGEAYAAELGLQFKVRSSDENDWIVIRNTEFLSEYLVFNAPMPSTKDQEAINALFSRDAWIRLKDLLEMDHQVSADAIFTMIARSHLYVALDKDLLAAPERTKVFRDVMSARAYELQHQESKAPMLPLRHTVVVEIGKSVLWADRSYRIANFSDEHIFLEERSERPGKRGGITALDRSDFEDMVRDHLITGVPIVPDIHGEAAEAALRHGSPTDIETATYRYFNLFPEKAETKVVALAPRTLRKMRALYRRGQQTCGSGYVGLLSTIHLKGNRERKLDQEVIAIMNAVIDELYATDTQRLITPCWGEVCLRCKEQGLTAPSEKSFRAQIKRRKSHGMLVAREGEKAAYNEEEFQTHISQATPRHGERPFQFAHIDHTEIDLQFVGCRKGENLGKAWHTAMIDSYTHDVLAWVIQFEEPSYRACMAVIRNCLQMHCRLPATLIVDKGKEFESKYFEQLLAFFGVTKKTRPSAKPRYGSMIERYFGFINTSLIHNLAGNNQALQKPRSMSASHDPRTLAVWNLPDFSDAFEVYLDRVYRETERQGLGMSVRQAIAVGFAQCGARAHTLIPYTTDVGILCLPTTEKNEAKVQAGRGVKINYDYYSCPEFREPGNIGKTVPVRYDPDDVSIAYAWVNGKWATCRAEFASVFQGCSEKEIAIASREIRARYGRTGKRRKLNAEIIASYLREAHVHEKVLAANKKHTESTEAKNRRKKGKNTPPIPASTTTDWDNVPVQTFGEFK